jgi:hypothetical protein
MRLQSRIKPFLCKTYPEQELLEPNISHYKLRDPVCWTPQDEARTTDHYMSYSEVLIPCGEHAEYPYA